MRYITITNEAVEAIRSRAEHPFKQTGHRLPNGMWSVPFEEDTIDRLEEHLMDGETISDVIVRACLTMGRPQN